MLLWLWPEDPFRSFSMNSVIYHVSGDDSHQVWSQLQRIYLNNASIKLVIGLARVVLLLIFPTCVLSHQALCFWLVPFLQLLVQKFPAVTVVAFQFEEWRLQFSFIMLKKTHVLEDGFCLWFKVQNPTSFNPIAEAFSSTKAPPGSSLVSFSTRTMKSTRNMRLCINMWILGVNRAGLSRGHLFF